MKKKSFFPIVALIFFLFIVMSFPKSSVEKFRGTLVASLAPVWETTQKIRNPSDTKDLNKDSYIELENQLLRSQLDGVYEWLLFEERIDQQVERMKSLSKEEKSDVYWNDFFRRRTEELRQILEIELQALPAKIVYREPSSWSSSVWVNVGEKNNEDMGRLIVAKNSPVVIGESLVGIVEYVGEKHSRVRLITDSGLVPSVRAVRGGAQNAELSQTARSLRDLLYARKELFSSKEDEEAFFVVLSRVIEKLSEKGEQWMLSKGELHGASQPLWRSRGEKLIGKGFNYDYEDEEGPSRDLRTGSPLGDKGNFKRMPLIAKGDLLITTGFDGVFPAGLHVATVTKIGPLHESGYAYEIEAKPTVENLSDLSVVFVIPPLGFQKESPL